MNNSGNNLNSYSPTRLEAACTAVKQSKNANNNTRAGAQSDLEAERTLAYNEIARLEKEQETANPSDQQLLDQEIQEIQDILDMCDQDNNNSNSVPNSVSGGRRRRRHARKTRRRTARKTRRANKKSRKNRKH